MNEYLSWSKLDPAAEPPKRKYSTDAGVDVCANETVWLTPFGATVVSTGLTFEVPEGHMILVKPKSGSNHLIGAGVIDAGYQGEILIKVINYRPWPIRIKKGQPIAQLITLAVQTPRLVEMPPDVIHHVPTTRGTSGGIVRQ